MEPFSGSTHYFSCWDLRRTRLFFRTCLNEQNRVVAYCTNSRRIDLIWSTRVLWYLCSVPLYVSCSCPAYFRGGTLKNLSRIARECSRSKQDIIDGQTSILSLQTEYRWYYPWYKALHTATQFSHYPIIISLKQDILSTRMSCLYGMHASGSLVFEQYVF
jgi:hypothetical protein